MILGYTRVSSMEQAGEGTTSLEEQRRKCKAIADLRGADTYSFLVYTDSGVSGSIPLSERPEGKKLLADAKKGDTIVAAKMDRLFRSASDALNTAARLKKAGVELVLVDMGVDPVTSNGASKMFFGMLALVAEFERERIEERMHDGRRAKKERGGHIAGSAPFGFTVDGHGKTSRLVPDAYEQQVLRRVLELKEEQGIRRYKVISRISRQLRAEGIVSPRTGKPFQNIQLQRIIARNTPEARA